MDTEDIYVYGARIIYAQLSAMQAEVEGVLCAKDIEHIHRMRVASRRLRSALKIFRAAIPKEDYKLFNKDIRTVTKSLGTARDIDVQLELLHELEPRFNDPKLKPGFSRLQLRLRQQRQNAQGGVLLAMKTLEDDQTLRQITRWAAPGLEQEVRHTAALNELGSESIKNRLSEMVEYDQLVRDETNVAELHTMRIRAKHLRYTMEAFDELYGDQIRPFISQLKKIQDLLGSIHDADVWMERIPNFIQEEGQRIEASFGHTGPLRRLLPGLRAFADDRLRIRADDYRDFIKLWDKSLESRIWEELSVLLQAPLPGDGISVVTDLPD